MTQATFDRHYLHRGEPADTRVALDTPAVAGSLKRALLRSRIKRAFS